jgi:excisionase family DNA binding protein
MTAAGRLAESVEDFAIRAGLGRTTIFRLIKDGQLESIKVGRRRLIPAGAGERLIARLQVAAVA